MLLICVLVASLGHAADQALVDRVAKAETITKEIIESIRAEWQVDTLPYFLKSCFMHKLSWELMKLKYQKKILTAIDPAATSAQPVKFVISFTGRYEACCHLHGLCNVDLAIVVCLVI